MSVFLWRLFVNRIPVDDVIQRMGISLASKCQCCQGVETVEHLFVAGGQARTVWGLFSFLFHLPTPSTHSLHLLTNFWKYSSPFTHTSHIRTLIPLLILWFIWTERNDAKYRGSKFRADKVIWRVHQHLQVLHKCGKFSRMHWKGDLGTAHTLGIHFREPIPRPPRQVLWRRPEHGWYKLNTDGASKGNPGSAGAGGIIRDFRGDPILAFQHYIGHATNTVAELSALLRGLELAVERDLFPLWIETDSMACIQLLSSRAGHWTFQHILLKISLILTSHVVKISHIFREGNGVADYLANQACSTLTSCILEPHQLVGQVLGYIRTDRLGFPSFRFR